MPMAVKAVGDFMQADVCGHSQPRLDPNIVSSQQPLLKTMSCPEWAWLHSGACPHELRQQMWCRQVEEPTPRIQGFNPGALEAWLARNSEASLVGTAPSGSPHCLQSCAACAARQPRHYGVCS